MALVTEARYTISMPVPSKSDTLRVASAAPWERQTAAISASTRRSVSGPLATAGDDRVMFRGCGIDRQDLICEGREDLVGRGEKDLLPASVWQPGNAVPDLCERDGGRAQLAPVPVADPAGDARRRFRAHQLGNHVRVEDDHAEKSAARAGSSRPGRSRSTPPSAPNRSRRVVNSPAESTGSRTASARIARALLHRPAVTSRANLKAPLHRFIKVPDVQCRHCYHLLQSMISSMIATQDRRYLAQRAKPPGNARRADPATP